MPRTHERVPFRFLVMPCCHHEVCWVNPRLPSHCPNCGTRVYPEIRSNVLIIDDKAILSITTEQAAVQAILARILAQDPEPTWLGHNFSGEGYAVVQCGEVCVRIGYTDLHSLSQALRLDTQAVNWRIGAEFLGLLTQLEQQAHLTTDLGEVNRRMAVELGKLRQTDATRET